MRRTVFALGSLLTVSLVSVGCAPPEDSVPEQQQEKTAETEAPIYYGTDDLNNDAVVFLYSEQGFACSGTIIHTNGNTGYVLTAGHCDGMDWVVQDDDLGCLPNNCDSVWSVAQQTVHPNFNPNDVGAGFDFSIIRFTGADANTPVIPAATSPDGLVGSPVNGTQVDISGYGETETGNSSDVRQHVTKRIVALDSSLMEFNQSGTSGGACSGDSGGPAIFNGEVVGVTSFGGDNCSGSGAVGFSGRVATVYNSFIAPIIGGAVVENCDTCFEDEVQSPSGDCAPQVNACFDNPACEDLNTCLGTCNNNATCIQNCANAAGDAAVNQYNAIFDCWCVSCATLCADECDPGSSTTSTGNGLSTGPGPTTGVGGAAGAGGAAAAGGGNPNNNDGGNSNDGGAGAADGGEDDGCGCSTVGAPERSSSLGLMGLALASVVVARRRRRTA